MFGSYTNVLLSTRKKCVAVAILTIAGIYSMSSIARISGPAPLEKYDGKATEAVELVKIRMETSTTRKEITTTEVTTEPLISQPSWINEASEMGLVDMKRTLRCKALYLGCFAPNSLPPYVKYTPTDVDESDKTVPFKERCLDACHTSGKRVAGFSLRRHVCVCSPGFEGFLSQKKYGRNPSKAWDPRCDSPASFYVYTIVRSCERGVSENTMKADQVGCIEVPKSLNKMMMALKNPQTTTEQCILNCELRKFTFAIPVPKENSCLCSDSYSLFGTPEDMQNIIGVCNERGDGERVPIFRTIVDDNHCHPIKFLNLGQADPILLASYYGSGNTWIRHLIEVSTGIYTGSVFNDQKLYEGGMLGESVPYDSGQTIAVKDHLFKLTLRPGYRMAILLLRNPYDATLAEWSRRKTKNHTGETNPETFKTQAFKKYAQGRPDYWYGLAELALKSFTKILVIYYEDVKKDAVKEMRRVVDFLPRKLVHTGEEFERRLMCMNLDLAGNFKRPPRKLDFDPYDAFLRNGFDQKIRELDDLLIKFQQPPLPDSYFLPT